MDYGQCRECGIPGRPTTSALLVPAGISARNTWLISDNCDGTFVILSEMCYGRSVHAHHGRHFLDQALCFRCTSRSHHHRLEAALGPLGSKPVACTGSILRFIAGDIQCRSTFLNRSAAQAQPSHN